MHYYLALTSKCNLLCKYCYGKSCDDYSTLDEENSDYDYSLPPKINFDLTELINYAKQDKNFTLTFYGGEPLLQIDLILEMMEKVPAKEFMMQTNAILLHRLPTQNVNKLSTILCSIDGTLEHTNERRGDRVYERVLKNVKFVRKNGFSGELIARMTVDETSDIFENVKHLIEIPEFSAVHWQLDAGFWESDYEQRDFENWVKNSYNPKITKLIDWWISEMKENGKVHRIYPFIGVFESILTGEKSPMKCGAGHSCLGIQTDGKVVACPITAGFKPLYMGDIRESSLEDVKAARINPDGFCNSCEIKDICGGRCLYWNKSNLWPEKGRKEICSTIFHLVESLNTKKQEILKLIEEGKIKREDFDYPKYNGCEIIP